MKLVGLKMGGIALSLMTLIGPACADAVFQLGNHPQPDEQNVLFQTDQQGSSIDGFTNQSNTLVEFSSTTDILTASANGQAKVEAQDGLLNDITISIPGHTMLDQIINPFEPNMPNDLIVTVTMSDGSIFTFGPYGDIHGNNFLTITTANNELISSVTIDSASGFADLRQPRVSGVSGVTVTPEPSSLLLLGSGLIGIARLGLRKRAKV